MTSSVLVERSFEVNVTLECAWALLAEVERWPEWAPHIRSARLEGELGPASEGRFALRPVGTARFRMSSWQPPVSWTWHGRAVGLPIDYHHHFETVLRDRTRLRWTVELTDGRVGARARAFARVYGSNLDRAWPGFVAWAESEAADGL